jgi:hypothetical protein
MKKRRTNTQFVEKIMDFSPYGALSHMFIMEAIDRYSKACAEQRLEEGGFINPDAWQALAVWIQKELKEHRA